ncbi:MAG: hypothetical protein K9H16_01310 [Bacteroidales bacterium]|nr:hypothetical protein [Bacteroidales bacterium]
MPWTKAQGYGKPISLMAMRKCRTALVLALPTRRKNTLLLCNASLKE